MLYLRLKPLFPFVVSTSLLALAGVFHSVGFAYASVLALVVALGRDMASDLLEAKSVKSSIPEEVKKQLQDLQGRITSIEAGIARRGF